MTDVWPTHSPIHRVAGWAAGRPSSGLRFALPSASADGDGFPLMNGPRQPGPLQLISDAAFMLSRETVKPCRCGHR